MAEPPLQSIQCYMTLPTIPSPSPDGAGPNGQGSSRDHVGACHVEILTICMRLYNLRAYSTIVAVETMRALVEAMRMTSVWQS
jgi:hypothetical protein